MFFMLIKNITNLHKLCKYAYMQICIYANISFVFHCFYSYVFYLFFFFFFLEEEFISEVYEIN